MKTTRSYTGVLMVDLVTEQSQQASSRHSWLQRWMRIVRTLGNVWAWIILTLFYVLVILPIGLLFRLSADPLRMRSRKASWCLLPSQYDRLEDAALQS